MKRFLIAAVLGLLSAVIAAAQEDYPKAEVFGGFSVLKLGVSEDFPGMAEFPASARISKTLSQGVNVSVSANLMENLGIVTDFRYNQGDVVRTVETTPAHAVRMRSLSLMAGPRYTLRKNERIIPFLHLLAGVDYWRLADHFTMMDIPMVVTLNDFGVGIAAGGGIDIKIHDSVAIRLIQADYYATRHAERKINNLNLAFGLVFRLGSK